MFESLSLKDKTKLVDDAELFINCIFIITDVNHGNSKSEQTMEPLVMTSHKTHKPIKLPILRSADVIVAIHTKTPTCIISGIIRRAYINSPSAIKCRHDYSLSPVSFCQLTNVTEEMLQVMMSRIF